MDREDLLSLIERPGAALLDGWSDSGRWTIALPEPLEAARFEEGEDERLDAFLEAASRSAADEGGRGDLPFAGGWIGYLAYELGAAREGAAPRAEKTPEPAALFYRHGAGWAVDPAGTLVRIGSGSAAPPPATPMRELAGFDRGNVVESLPGPLYDRAHDAIRSGIARGDFYQVNLTTRFCARISAHPDARTLFRTMTAPLPPPYSMLLRGEGFDVVSASPELFLRADFRTGEVEMRPIKGTAPRDSDPGRDTLAARHLASSRKDRAENVMIADLCRNDLGRVCLPGTVDVPALCRVRSHRVHHLETVVRGKLRPGVSASGLLRSTFPPGSVTGAPKRAAVSAIRSLEPVARGVYTGAAGYLDSRGTAAFNVAIRTAVSTGREIRYHAGGGITWDSVAAREREEIGWKAAEFFDLFGGER
jgi:anthranilate/para-aminobenzoate synthase component I